MKPSPDGSPTSLHALILEQITDAVITIDHGWRILTWNRAAEQLYGWSAAEVIGRVLSDILPVERYLNGGDTASASASVLEHGAWRGEVIHRHRDGRPLVIDSSVHVMRDPDGAPIGLVGVNRDITERRAAEANLEAALLREQQARIAAQEAERRLQYLASAADAMSTAPEYQSMLERLVSDTVPAFADLCAFYVFDPDGRAPTIAFACADPAKRAPFEALCASYASRLDDPRSFLGGVRAAARSGFTPHITPEQVDSWAADETHRALLRRIGFGSQIAVPLLVRQQVTGLAIFILAESGRHYVPEDLALTEELARRAALAIENARLQQTLAKNEARFRALVQNTTDIILFFDGAGRLQYTNPAFQAVLGYSPGIIAEIDPMSMIHPDDRALAEEAHARWSASFGVPVSYTLRMRRADGTWAWLESVAINSLNDPDIQGLVINSRDVTDRRRLEAQFLQAQKMEGIGRLAGGVAHDFNNLLTAIGGYTALLAESLPKQADVQEDLAEIVRATERAAGLTSQLLAFARKQVMDSRPLDLNRLVTGLGSMLRRLIRENIELITRLQGDLSLVLADEVQIEQLLVNLVVNARDAMPEGGRLVIETSNLVLEEMLVNQKLPLAPGHYVLLTVSDTGVGMDEYVLEHLYEPFFTTKGPDHGSGLGLATCYGIVKQHGGHIWCYSELGRGTTFKIYLPRCTDAAPEEAPPAPLAVQDGHETLLLVEDDDAVRALAARVLLRRSYRVLEASDHAEALEAIAAHHGPLDLLLTDIGLPGGSGTLLAERVRERIPGIKVLFMSAYPDDALVHHGPLGEGVAFIQKPFTPAMLASKIREVLGG
jgi:PAS domain S-box-containing protein